VGDLLVLSPALAGDRRIGDAQLLGDRHAVVAIEDVAGLVDLDRDHDAALADVCLKRLVLVGGEVREQLVAAHAACPVRSSAASRRSSARPTHCGTRSGA
jgi:hypothetical protein